MQSGGRREVESARADDRWRVACQSVAAMEVPAELADALNRNRKAQAFFDTLDRSNR